MHADGTGKGGDLQERLVIGTDGIAFMEKALLGELFTELLENSLLLLGAWGHVVECAKLRGSVCGGL